MSLHLLRGIVAAASVAVLGGVGAAATTPSSSPAQTLTIHIKDFTYRPTPVTVHVGDRVTFINDDDEAHTVTASDKSFDSGGLDTGKRWDHAFTAPGTFAYFCALHPYMKATVVVVPAVSSGSQR